MDRQHSTGVIMCAGGVVLDSEQNILLVIRLNPPEAGLWSLPGGKSEPGERPEQTAAREIFEETGLRVSVQRLLGVTRRESSRPGISYEIHDFLCRPISGELRKGDDAKAAAWHSQAQLKNLPLTQDLVEILHGWKVFDSSPLHTLGDL